MSVILLSKFRAIIMSNASMNLVPTQEVTIVGPVVEHLLSHLDDESAALAAMLNAVRDVHNALKCLDDETLRKSLESEAHQLSSSISLQQRRSQLQGELASVLNVAPQDVTLRRLIAMTSGSLRESIERLWRSLTAMAAEIERLNRQNSAMISQSLAIARGVVERLTGVSGVGESYNAVGARAETHVGPLIQWGA
jgi:hypothetical protein